MDCEAVLKRLLAAAERLGEIDPPDASGAYVVLIDKPGSLASVPIPASRAIYLGIGLSLLERDLKTHFSTGTTGSSTLRRSLGAILRQQLALQPRPRGQATSRRDYTHYCFDEAGEERLTKWMNAHLRLGVHKLSGPKAIEGELIRLARPPLNLTKWKNPWGPTLRALRAECVRQALASFPRRGGT